MGDGSVFELDAGYSLVAEFECGCPRTRQVHYWQERLPAPCGDCGGHWRPIAKLHPLPGQPWKARDETITPEQAAEWLADARSCEGDNDAGVVGHYAELMRRGEWTDMTLGRGGLRCPIVFGVGGHARYGLQRLEACVRAGVPFRAVVVRPATTSLWRSERSRHPHTTLTLPAAWRAIPGPIR